MKTKGLIINYSETENNACYGKTKDKTVTETKKSRNMVV
jgi:hypothetical protein